MKIFAQKFTRITGANYASFPEISSWKNKNSNGETWKSQLSKAYERDKNFSIYIHLPFCESLCPLCSFGPLITRDHTVEDHYLENILNEVDKYIAYLNEKPIINEIYLGGGTPHFFSGWNINNLINRLSRKTIFSPDVSLRCEVNPYSINPEKLKALKVAGINEIKIGIQDLDPRVQKGTGRKMENDDFKKLFHFIHGLGFNSISLEVIIGLPFQTRKSIIDTIYKIREIKPDQIILQDFIARSVKSPSHKKIIDNIPIPIEQDYLKDLAHHLLIESGYSYLGMDHYILKGDWSYRKMANLGLSYHSFGYSFHSGKHVIGLGVAALSDLWTSTAQNFRGLSDWEESTKKGKKEKLRFQVYSETELKSREHIHNIQTKGQTEWTTEEINDPAFLSAINKLTLLSGKNTLEIKDNKLLLHHEAKRNMRLICSILDVRNSGNSNLQTRKSNCYGTEP